MSWIQTHSGKDFDFSLPTISSIEIEDIAHALSLQCRYNGHCLNFYSVAEHSVIMSMMMPPELRLAALMHDAAEAYISDLPKPIKRKFPDFCVMENNIMAMIRVKFNIPWNDGIERMVSIADLRMLKTEKEQIMRQSIRPWTDLEGVVPFDYMLPCWAPIQARRMFLDKFLHLTRRES